MTLPRETVELLLPCYLCGDLPEELLADVGAAIAADPDLRMRLHTLGDGREACRAALQAAAGALPELGDAGLPSPNLPPQSDPGGAAWPGLLAAVAAAILLMATFAGAPPQPEELRLLAVHRSAVAAGPAFIEATDGARLSAAFRAAGVSPSHAMAPDLSGQGYRLLGGMVNAQRNGVAVVYEKDGKRFVCQIYAAEVSHSRPDRVRRVRGVTLRGFQQEGASVVAWTAGSRTCLFSGEAPLDTLLAEAAARLSPTRG